MSRKKTDFMAGLKVVGKDPEPAPAPAPDPVPAAEVKKHASQVAMSRIGKKAITGHFDPVVRKQLAMLAVTEDKTQNALLAEALNLLFQQYGKAPIAKG